MEHKTVVLDCVLELQMNKNANNPLENYMFAKKTPDGPEYFNDS